MANKCTCDCTPCRCKDEVRTTLAPAKTWNCGETFVDENGRTNKITFLPEGDGKVAKDSDAAKQAKK